MTWGTQGMSGTSGTLVSEAEKLNPMPTPPIETVLALGSVVAVVFVFFALWKVARHEWTWPYAIGLVLISFIIPFSGPVVAVVRAWWLRRRR